MVDLSKKVIVIGDNVYPIKNFQVWWLGPLGLVPTLELAEQSHKILEIQEDTPFHLMWKAIPVAVSDNGVYEELR